MPNVSELVLPPALRFVAIDLPSLRPCDEHCVVVVMAAGAQSPTERFRGANVYEALETAGDYLYVQTLSGDATLGLASTTLGGGVSGRFWDTENTVTVVLDDADAELASAEYEDVAAGRANVLVLGEEILGFATATLTAERTYVLSELLRGRRGTGHMIDEHVTGEQVLILTSPSAFQFFNSGLTRNASHRFYKAVPAGYSPSDVDEEVVLLHQSNSIRPFAPIRRPQVANAAGDLTLAWQRRSRTMFRLLGGVIAPLNESSERYEVDVYDGTWTTVLRTISVTGQTSTVYTAAMQTTDFGAPQSSVNFIVYQLSDVVARGFPSEENDMATDPVTGATLLAEGTAAAETLVNEMLARLLAGRFAIASMGDTTPPGAPINFDAYIVGTSATGAWSGQDGNIAIYLDGWKFMTPKEGMSMRVKDTDVIIDYDGTTWSALAGEQQLTDGANIDWNMALGNAAYVTLGGDRTMNAPTNVVTGRRYTIVVIQDGTGTRLITWNSAFKWPGGAAPTLSTGAAAKDVFEFVARGGGALYNVAQQLNLS